MSQKQGLFLVADGVGGYTGGDIAAETVIATIIKSDLEGLPLETGITKAELQIKKFG